MRVAGRCRRRTHSLTCPKSWIGSGASGQRQASLLRGCFPPLVRAVTTQEKKPRATLPHTHMQGATAAAQAPAGGGGLVSPSSTPARPSKRSLRSHHTRPEHPTTRGRRIRFPSSPLIDTRRKKEYQAVAGPSGVTKLARTGSRSLSVAPLLSSLPRFLLSSS